MWPSQRKKSRVKAGKEKRDGEKKKEEKKYGFDWGLEPKAVYKPEDLEGMSDVPVVMGVLFQKKTSPCLSSAV